MQLTNELRIRNLSEQRLELLDKYDDSWDEEKQDFTLEYPNKIDEIAEEILDRIKKWKNSLSIEFILEELTNLGWAPCLLYDDDGHWAITGTGMQSIGSESPDDCELSHFVKKEEWKDSIRKALDYYLDNE